MVDYERRGDGKLEAILSVNPTYLLFCFDRTPTLGATTAMVMGNTNSVLL